MMREIRCLVSLAFFTSLPLGQNFLELQPEYIIGGELEGAIVADEEIRRNELRWLIIDFVDGQWEGGFHTSGSKFGRKGSLVMTGVDVVLTKK